MRIEIYFENQRNNSYCEKREKMSGQNNIDDSNMNDNNMNDNMKYIKNVFIGSSLASAVLGVLGIGTALIYLKDTPKRWVVFILLIIIMDIVMECIALASWNLYKQLFLKISQLNDVEKISQVVMRVADKMSNEEDKLEVYKMLVNTVLSEDTE